MSDEFREVDSRIRVHGIMIALSYGHGVGCGSLTDDEAVGLRRLAQMVMRGVTWFEASDFGKPLGWDDVRSTGVIDSLRKKHPQLQVACDNGDVAQISYCNAAHIGTVEHLITESGSEHKIYNFLIDGAASHFAREMGWAE